MDIFVSRSVGLQCFKSVTKSFIMNLPAILCDLCLNDRTNRVIVIGCNIKFVFSIKLLFAHASITPSRSHRQSDKLEVHMFSADGGGPPFSSFYPFPSLSAAGGGGGGPSSVAVVPSSSAGNVGTGTDTAAEMYSDASQEGE